MSEFKVIETQEEFDAAIKDRIDRLNKKHEGEVAEYVAYKTKNEELTKQIEELNQKFSGFDEKAKAYNDEITALKSKNDELSGLLSEKDKTIHEYELDKTRLNIAAEFNIPSNALNFLQGDTEDAIRESAKQLKSVIGVSEPITVVPSGESTKDSNQKDFYSAFKSMSNALSDN